MATGGLRGSPRKGKAFVSPPPPVKAEHTQWWTMWASQASGFWRVRQREGVSEWVGSERQREGVSEGVSEGVNYWHILVRVSE